MFKLYPENRPKNHQTWQTLQRVKLTYMNDTKWWAFNTDTVWLHWCDTRCKSRTDSWGLLTALRVLLDSCLSVHLFGSLGWGPPLPTVNQVLIFSAAGCIYTLKPDSSALWQQQHLTEAHLGSLTSSAQTTQHICICLAHFWILLK